MFKEVIDRLSHARGAIFIYIQAEQKILYNSIPGSNIEIRYVVYHTTLFFTMINKCLVSCITEASVTSVSRFQYFAITICVSI